jgi:hypothetical protein
MTSLETIQPMPGDVVFRQFVDHHAPSLKSNPYWYSPDHWYRWLVRLDCGCVTEALTFGDESPPPEHRYHPNHVLGDPPLSAQAWILHPDKLRGACIFKDAENPFPRGCCEPPGLIWCAAHGGKLPWRDVVQWIDRTAGQERESGKPYASWTVKLSCGHCYSSNISDVGWSPGMPPDLDLKLIETLKRRLSAEWKDRDDDEVRDLREEIEHKGSLVSSPATEEQCPKCAYLRRIAEYRLIGKLADRPVPEPVEPEPVAKPRPTAEEIEAKKRRRLRRVESDLARLQNEAEQLRSELGTAENAD